LVSKHKDLGTAAGQLPVAAPIGEENVTKKNAMFNTLTERIVTNTGPCWPDKMECFLAKFEDILPAAKLQANMAIENLDNIGSDVFEFADMETLDTNLVVMPRGNFSQNTRDCTGCLRFTITVSPRLIVPGAMDFDPSTFPNPTSTTVCVRAPMHNGGLTQGTTKHLLDNPPKLVLFFYEQAKAEFDASIKHQSDTALDQEKHSKWLKRGEIKTKLFAAKHCVQRSYVGRLEGTETLAQRLTSLRQRTLMPRSRASNICWCKNCTKDANSF
jgi:hypothetical protein